MGSWLPWRKLASNPPGLIADAPRDGSEILGFCPDIGWRVVAFDTGGRTLHGGWFLVGMGGEAAEDCWPTHFTELPPPPGIEP